MNQNGIAIFENQFFLTYDLYVDSAHIFVDKKKKEKFGSVWERNEEERRKRM